MYQKYLTYSSQDFAADPFFREWVLSPPDHPDHFWKGFVETYPHKNDNIREAKTLVLAVEAQFEKQEVSSEEKNRYFDQVLTEAEGVSQSRISILHRLPVWRWAVAASILLLLGLGYWVGEMLQPQVNTYSTQYGEWKTVMLPDGSKVNLNANSEITFASSWQEGEDRKVWLKGEAYFDVEKKPATGAKFVVISGEVSVEVLGTKFNVYQRGDQTEVYLEEGRIKLAASKQEKLMQTGDVIRYSSKEKKITAIQKVTDNALISWKDGNLILRESSIKKIIQEVEEIYGVTLIVENPRLLSDHFTLQIPMDEWEIAFPVIEKMLGVKIIKKGGEYFIK